MNKPSHIGKEISSKVLVIGPDYRIQSGGIAIVMNSFFKYYKTVNFIPSTLGGNLIKKICCFLLCIIKLIGNILSKKTEIIHIHGSSHGSFTRKRILIYICSVSKMKIIYHVHGGAFVDFYENHNKNKRIDKTLSKVDILIVLSEKWKNFFKTIVPEEKIRILNNITEEPNKQKNVSLDKKDPTLVKFLFLGKIMKAKGVFDLLKVVEHNKNKLDGKILIEIGGNGDLESIRELKTFIEENKLTDIVKFRGWVDGTVKEDLLSSSDVYVLPSYNEGLPISILEAMSYGMPIISTDVGGISEIVENNKNGFLIQPGDQLALFESLMFFVDNPQELNKMGVNSLKLIENYYPKNVIPQLSRIYSSLLKQ